MDNVTPANASSTPTFQYYTGRAVVNLDAISHNVAVMKDLVQSHSPTTQVMAVVKGGAYGHGLIESAKASARGGATWFGTAQAIEAMSLREAGFTQRILTWLHTPGIDYRTLIEQDIDISVAAPWAVAAVADAAQEAGKPARVHLKVDTGLGRNGATLEDLNSMIEPLIEAQNAGHIEWVGIWSHFAFADEPEHPTVIAQADVFAHLPSDHGVSYGHQYRTPTDTQVAVVPLGYADGIPRHASGFAERGGQGAPLWIDGQRCAIAGRVCMDQFVVDLGSDTHAQPGDTAVLFGDPQLGHPTADEWAQSAGTISYEIITRIGERVPRIYVGNTETAQDTHTA